MSCDAVQLRRLARFASLRAILMGLAVLAGCSTLPSARDTSAQRRAPLIGAAGQLSERQAEAAIQDTAGNTASAAQADPLTDAVRKATDSPFLLGNKAIALIDGPQTFAHITRQIELATSSVHLETYIFADDELGNRLADLLMRKARQGVEVRVIFDAVGSMSSSAALFDRMRASGVQVAEFRPLQPLKTLPWRYHNRDHRKLVVVDGKVAFTGGINISSTYSSKSSLRPGPERGVTEGWRDTHVQIEGPVVRQFQAIFLETWVRLNGQVDANNAKYFPNSPPVGMDIVAAVVSSGVRQRDEAIYNTYLASVTHAASRIWITQAYFSPPPELCDAMIAAARRGVDVRVIVPGFTDSGPVFYAARANYEKLLAGGVHLYELKDALLHAKTAVIDQRMAIIGSANLDYRSFLHNNEVTAVVIAGDLAHTMEEVFNKDLADTHELTLEQWRKRPLGERLKESVSHWFNYWL